MLPNIKYVISDLFEDSPPFIPNIWRMYFKSTWSTFINCIYKFLPTNPVWLIFTIQRYWYLTFMFMFTHIVDSGYSLTADQSVPLVQNFQIFILVYNRNAEIRVLDVNAECHVFSHMLVCNCPENYTENLFTNCYPKP